MVPIAPSYPRRTRTPVIAGVVLLSALALPLSAAEEPRAILAKTAAVYVGLSTYSDQGTVVLEGTFDGKSLRREVRFALRLGRPDRYRATWESQTPSAPARTSRPGAAWSSRQGFGLRIGSFAYRLSDAAQPLHEATFVSLQATETIPALFFPSHRRHGLLQSEISDLRLLRSEVFEAEECYVLAGSGRSPVLPQVTLWISKSHWLLLRFEEATADRAVVRTEAHTSVHLDERLDDKAFADDLPPDTTWRKSLDDDRRQGLSEIVDEPHRPGRAAPLLVSLRLRATGEDRPVAIDHLDQKARALPGVVSAAFTDTDRGRPPRRTLFAVEKAARPPGDAQGATAAAIRVSPSYFATLGIVLVRGRALTTGDSATTPPVALINDTMARTLWPGADPLGQRIHLATAGPAVTVVGILADVPGEDWTIYLPLSQGPTPAELFLLLRTAGDPTAAAASLRDAVCRGEAGIRCGPPRSPLPTPP